MHSLDSSKRSLTQKETGGVSSSDEEASEGGFEDFMSYLNDDKATADQAV